MVATPLFFKKEIIFGQLPRRDPGCDTLNSLTSLRSWDHVQFKYTFFL